MATLNVSGGGTIKLTPGETYTDVIGLISPYSALPNNTSLVCDGPAPAIIAYSSNQGYAMKSVSAGQSFKRIRFTNGGLFLESAGCQNVTVDNCEFAQSVTTGPKQCGLELSSPGQSAVITNNLFAGTNKSLALYAGAGGTNCTVANNEFINVFSGIHWDGGGTNTLIEQNYGTGITGQFIELQGNPVDLVVQDNDYEKPTHEVNGSKYAYSIPVEGGKNIIVRRNRSRAPKNADVTNGETTRIVFELGGKYGVDASDNYSDGGNDVVAINGAGATGKVHDNRFANYHHMTGNNNGATCTLTNNGPNVVLTWDINRERPKRNVRYGTTPIPPQPPQYLDDPLIDVTHRFKSGKVVVTRP